MAVEIRFRSSELAGCLCPCSNSIFVGDRVLTTANPERGKDESLLDRGGMRAETPDAPILLA